MRLPTAITGSLSRRGEPLRAEASARALSSLILLLISP